MWCNSLLSRLPKSTVQPLQRVMNAAARVIMNLSLRDHVKPALKQLHGCRSSTELHTSCVDSCTYHIHIGQAPQYLSDCVSTASEVGGRYRLRSTGSAAYVRPRTKTRFGERGFFYSGPAAWNTLPSDLHDISLTLVLSENDSRMYFLIILALLDVSYIAAPYKFYVDWLIDWLIDWLVINTNLPLILHIFGDTAFQM